MDKREAIQELKQWRDQMESHGVPDYGKKLIALDLAIEALRGGTQGDAESATTTDCISRQQAIEAVVNEWKGGFPQTNFLRTQGFHDWLKRILDDLPPVTPKVSEDCISRQDAIEALLDHVNIPTQAQREYAVEIFENIPPVEPKPVCEDAISRADTIKAMCSECEVFPGDDMNCADCTEVAIVRSMPPVTQTERPKGEWIDMSDGGRIKYIWYEKYMCNNCGERGTSAWSFCPNCGADMRGAE